jgi:hypothetical protein
VDVASPSLVIRDKGGIRGNTSSFTYHFPSKNNNRETSNQMMVISQKLYELYFENFI